MVLDVKLLQNSLQLQDEVRSPAALVAVVLEVYRVSDIETQFQPVHVLDLLNHHAVPRTPVLGLAVYVPASFQLEMLFPSDTAR